MQISQGKFKYYCPKHPDFKFEFLQVDNFSNNKKYQKLFYCSDCAYQDLKFKHQNYSLIKHIIKSGNNQIVQNWPPVNDKLLIKQLIKLSVGKEEIESIKLEIEHYFAGLKTDILKQIDICQKKMIQQVEEQPLNKADILNKYQAISKVNELQSIFLDNKTDIHEKEEKYKVFVEHILAQKKIITEQLTSLRDQYQKGQTNFNSELALEIKEQILKSINNINMFEQVNVKCEDLNSNHNHLDLQLITTDFKNGNNNSEISKNQNNQYQIQIKKDCGDWLNIVSNIILENDIKYIFRIKIQLMKIGDTIGIGLMQNSKINSEGGYRDKLCCSLVQQEQYIYQIVNYGYGIDKVIKGTQFRLSEENEVELRVCIRDQVIEVLDYPNYHCKLTLLDKQKSNLAKHSDLRLYLGLWKLNNTAILKEAFTLDNFY